MRQDKPMAAIPGGPYRWHEHRDLKPEGFERTYVLEAMTALRHWNPVEEGSGEKISNALLSLRVAEYHSLVAAAKSGTVNIEGWNPAGNDPVVWELRLSYGGELFRFYFAEPKDRIDIMIALAAQHKDITLPDEEIHEIQDDHIGRATKRFHLGKDWAWGADDPTVATSPQLDHYR